MKKSDLREVLELVKDKLGEDAAAACGLLWSDIPKHTTTACGEEDAPTEYAVAGADVWAPHAAN